MVFELVSYCVSASPVTPKPRRVSKVDFLDQLLSWLKEGKYHREMSEVLSSARCGEGRGWVREGEGVTRQGRNAGGMMRSR